MRVFETHNEDAFCYKYWVEVRENRFVLTDSIEDLIGYLGAYALRTGANCMAQTELQIRELTPKATELPRERLAEFFSSELEGS